MPARCQQSRATGRQTRCCKPSLANSYPAEVRHNAEEFRKFRARWLANDPQSFAAINRMLADSTVTEELGSEINVIFRIDVAPVATEAVRAAAEPDAADSTVVPLVADAN